MGYEIDSTMIGREEYDPFRPAPRLRLGSIYDRNGDARGSAGYYKHPSGAEVVAFSSIAWSWALDSFASGTTSVDSRAQRMVTNALTRWTGGAPALAYEVKPDQSTPFITDNALALTSGDIALEEQHEVKDDDDPPPAAAESNGACSVGRSHAAAPFGLLVAFSLVRVVRALRSRARSGSGRRS